MNRFLWVAITVIYFSPASYALDPCDGLFNDPAQIIAEVLKSPVACDAFAKANRFAGDERKITIRSEAVLDSKDDYFATRYIVSVAGRKVTAEFSPVEDKVPHYGLATLKFVSRWIDSKCVFNTSPQYSEGKIPKADYEKL